MTDVGQDFTKITDEEVLKKMWQDTNDFGRKKEIRTYMYKLREARLRDLYDMDATGANYNVSKTSSHGDLVADHSFASMKAKEVRDSESPIRDNRGGIIRPATGEWNVISSTEQSSDGKEAKHHTLATTGGVKNISGGKKTFAGLEEEQSHRRVEGDDKNFKRTEGQSSTTQLSEHTVTGNEQDGKVEKFSKSYQTSSSSVTRSGKTITNDFDSPDFAPVQPRSSAIHKNEKYDENLTRHDSRQSMTTSENTSRRESTNRNQEQIYRENVNQQQQQSNQYSKNTSSTNQTDHQNQQVQQNVQKTDTQNISGHHLQTSRDPNRVVEAFRLAEKPGQVVARTVVHTKPDTVCITETKVLTDGTKVTTKRYERVSTQSDIQTLRKQYNAIDSSNTTMRTSTTDKKFTDEMTNQQTNLRQSRAPERTTIDQRTKIDQNNAQVKKIQINQEETETVTKSKIINTDGKEIYLTPGQKIVVEIPGTNVTRVERTEHRETLTKIPGELPAEQDVVIEERFITHYDNKDKVRRDSYTKTEVTEKVVDEQNIQSTSNKTISQKPRQPTQPVDSRNVRDTRISVEVDKTHQAWASSLRCITPPPEGQAQPNYQSPSSKRPSRRSPSRDSDVTKISNTTITRSTQYIPSSNVSKKTVTTEFRTQIQSPDRRPTVKGGRPQRPGTDSESEDQISRKTSLRKTSTDRSENIRTETNKFIRNESTVTDNKVTKSKPVLKRTETYEDRCKFLIGIPDKPTTPTNRQRSEDNLTPRKPNKSVTDDIDTKQKTVNQFTKTTSDITFDKKTLRTAQVNVDKSSPKKPTYKTELKRTISPVDETSDETKNTTHRTEITKIVNVEDDKKFTSDTVSSTLKKVRPSDSVPRDQSPANATTFTTNETETITITRTDNKPVKEPKKPSQDTRKTVNRRFDEYTSTTEDEEYSNTTKIRNETRSSSIKDSNYDKVTSKTPDSNKPQNRGTYKVTETVEITNTVIDDKNKTPTTKKPLKKGSNLVTDSDDEDVRETKERQTSSFTDETISSTLKKTDTAFDYQTSKDELFNQPSARKPQDKQKPSNDFINNERIHSTTTTSETVTNKLDSNFISKPKDKKPYDCNDQLPSSKTRNDKFTKYETETVQITRSVNDQPDQRPSGKKPVLKKGPKLDTDTDEYEESIERRTSSYADDTISSTLKKVDTTFEYNPSNDQNKPENEPWHSASSNEPHPSDKLKHDEFVKNEQTHTNNTYNVVQKQKVEHIDETYESSDYERKVSTTYLDDTVSSNLKKVHPDDIEDHYRTRSRSRDKSPSVTSNTDQRDARNKEKPISEHEPWHQATSNEPHSSDYQKPAYDFITKERIYTDTTTREEKKHPKKYDDKPSYKNTEKIERMEESYESSDYERKVSTTYLDDTVSSNLKKVHPDDIEDHHRTRSRSRDKSPSVTSNTDQRDTRNKEKPISEHEPWHQATSNEPHSSDYQKPAYDFITKERIYTDTTKSEEKKYPKKYDDKPSYKNTEKIERMEESYESSDYERKVSTTYLDDTVSSNLKKVHPDDIEDHHRTRSRSRDKSPSVTSNTDQRDTRNKEKPISEHEPWHQATSNEPHSSDYQKPVYDFITQEKSHTDTTHRTVKKDKPKGYGDQPDDYRSTTRKSERMEESYESSDYERKISTTYLDDTVSSNLKKVHPDDIEDHHRTRSRSRDKSPSVSSNVEFTKRTTTIEDEVKLLENYQKTRPNQKSKSEPKTKKRTDSESDTDEEDLVVEQYNVDTTTGKISSYDDETVSSSLKKIKTEPIREKSPRRVVKQLFEEETDEKEFSSKIVTNKKVTEIKQSFEEPKPKNVTPKPTTKIIKEEKITKVREVFEGPSKKPTEIVKNIKVKKTVDDRSSEFITNEITTSKPTTNKPEKVDESTRFIKTEERFTASNTMRQATPTVTKKSTPKSKEDKPRRGSIVEITIDVKEDVVDDQRRSSNSRPSRTHDKKGVTKTKTVTTTVRKEIEDSDEQYSSSDNRRNRRPITKTTTDESPRRKIVTETITIKKDVDDETVNRIKTREELKSSTVKKNSKISSNDEKTPINPKLIKTSDVDSPKVGKHQKKCITTKTINLTTKTINSDNLQENIIIDIQKAKSSREPSPNRLIPVPVSPDNEHVKTLPQRFPDKVVEPDDVKQKRKPVVKNIPIFEEQTNDFVGIKIEEVDDSTIDIRETSTNYTHTEVSSDDDVATLSVSQKVSKFITEAEKLKSPSPSRSTKFDRDVNFDKKRERFINEKIIEEASESETETITRRKESVETYSDRCFLDKKPKYPDSHESSPILTRKLSDRFDDRHTKEKSPSVTLKSTEVVQNITKKTTQKFETKDFDRPVTKESSPVSLKSTEAVKKAKAIFETKASPSLGTTPSKPRPFLYDTKTAVNEEDFEKKNITLVEAYEEKIVPRSAYKTYKKDQTPERQSSRSRLEDEIIPIRDSDELISASRPYSKTPEREPVKQSPVKQNPVKTREEPSYLRKETQNYESSYNTKTTSKSPRRPSNDNPPRNSNPSRTSYDESPQRNNPQRRDSSGNAPHNPNRRYSSETPPYMKDAVSTKKDIFEKKITTTNTETFERRKSMSPQVEDLEKPVYNNKSHTSKVEYERSSSRELPSYMSPTVSSLVHSNRKFSIETQVKQVQNVVEEDEHVEEIVLKNKRPSYQRTPSKETPRKMSVTEGNIEDIFDLEILERMLETVVGYEQRRRIRAQIRIVKKLITEGKVTTDGNVSTKLTTKTTTTTRRQSSEHTAPQTRDSHVVESYHTVRNMSPATAKRTTTTTVEEYRAKNNEQPKLVKKETHKTVSGYGTPKRTTPQKSTAKTTTKQQETKTSQRTSNREEFGVTPAFEDGMPLFGLKALRKRDGPSYVQSKVTGTTVTEKRYSENGKAPIGERKVTHYSTDPSDLEKLLDKDQRTPSEIREKLFERQHSRSKGISAVTLIEKFGEDIEQERAILDNVSEPSTVATNTSRTSRKSVEALKQKFSSMDQSSSVTETTTSCYPKAGLILRSQSRSSRSSTPGASSFRSGSVDFDESDVEIRSLTRKTSRERISSSRQIVSHDPFEDDEGATKSVKRITTKITKSGGGNKVESFLDSESKVTDIQDLLSRMKALDNAPKKAGETSEDHEARALLNRFLGATVLMSGAEQILSDSGDSGIANQKVTTKTSTSTRTFSSVHPASGNKAIDTENINDEETLRQLIESSTSYDERRILRARLRQLMADKGTTGDKNITKKEESSEVTMHKTLGNESTMTKAVTTKTVSSSISKNNSSSTTALKSSSNSSLNKVQANQSLFMKNMSSLTGVSATSSPAVATTVTPRGESNIQKMLQWAQNKTRGYENVKIENFSSSWQDGMAFCALIHHFYPDAFDFSKLNPKNRRGNFTLAFRVAEDKAGIAPLLDVDDMVMMKKPDWKCVFTYVQSMHRHLREKSI